MVRLKYKAKDARLFIPETSISLTPPTRLDLDTLEIVSVSKSSFVLLFRLPGGRPFRFPDWPATMVIGTCCEVVVNKLLNLLAKL
jgi:hypothetical protein